MTAQENAGSFSPPYVSLAALPGALKQQGFALLDASSVCQALGVSSGALQELSSYWNDLPPDAHLKDGGRYRKRRHSCFVVDATAQTTIKQAPHRAHWQPLEYNALHGGMQRWFEPMQPQLLAHPACKQLLLTLALWASLIRRPQPWFVEAHQFRIDTTDGIGRPTPEGAHRDGVDLVAVFMVARQHIKGGESRVFEAAGPSGQRFTLMEPWSLLLLDDARVIHESTPIQPLTALGWRDTLVVTCRAGGFQGD